MVIKTINNENSLVIAIDGMAGTGKSSAAKQIAIERQLAYLDTGAMYRAATYWLILNGIDVRKKDLVQKKINDFNIKIKLDPKDSKIKIGNKDVTKHIRSIEISKTVSVVAKYPFVRQHLIRLQQSIVEREKLGGYSAGRGIVLEGRDTTTVVAPKATLRVLIVASQKARENRRKLQNDIQIATEDLKRDIKDSSINELVKPSKGVNLLDNSNLNLNQTVKEISNLLPKFYREPRPSSFLADKVPSGFSASWSKAVGKKLTNLIWDVTQDGSENIPATGKVIFAINHINFWDPVAMFAVVPRPLHFMAKHELFKGPKGLFFRATGQIPVDRQDGQLALKKCLHELDLGRAIGIFPQGTRTPENPYEIKAGVAWLAVYSGAPVIPVACLGTKTQGKSPSHIPKMGQKVHYSFGLPINININKNKSPKEVIAIAKEKISKQFFAHLKDAQDRTGIYNSYDS